MRFSIYDGLFIRRSGAPVDVFEESDNDYRVVQDGTGSDRRIAKQEIKSLAFNDFVSVKSYPVLGATLGTPGGIMPVVGYHFGNFALQASGMYLGLIAGAELEAQWKFIDDPDITHGLALLAGYLRLETKDTTTTYSFTGQPLASKTITNISTWTYAGLSYSLNWALFYFKAGISFGAGSYINPQLLFQIGILNRFNRQKVQEPQKAVARMK